eukprot:TRINITY_DN4611_c0_g1_i1.p1 TRINITY_DN4611_c0_g1~~TRINITY_DN4611_c0_g1_i1.p1  ORF type:complete len:157 (+),score=18.81 TRINITY_DN4611_c0_g1_i1:102-572(+)
MRITARASLGLRRGLITRTHMRWKAMGSDDIQQGERVKYNTWKTTDFTILRIGTFLFTAFFFATFGRRYAMARSEFKANQEMMKSNPEMAAQAVKDYDDNIQIIRRQKVWDEGLFKWWVPFPFSCENRFKTISGPTDEQLAETKARQAQLGLDGSK